MGGNKSHGRAAGIINWHYSHRRSRRRRRPFPKRNERGYGEGSGVLARELGCFSFETIYHVTLLTDLPCPLRAESRIQGKRACGFFWARPPIVCVRLWVTGQKPVGMRLCGSGPGSNPSSAIESSDVKCCVFAWRGFDRGRGGALPLFLPFGIAVAAGCCIRRDSSVHPFRGSVRRVPNQNAPSPLFAFATGIPFDAKKTPQRSLAESPGLVGRSPCFFAVWS